MNQKQKTAFRNLGVKFFSGDIVFVVENMSISQEKVYYFEVDCDFNINYWLNEDYQYASHAHNTFATEEEALEYVKNQVKKNITYLEEENGI